MTYKKLRRSGRISKSVPILLIGSDTEGRVFSEVTHTVVLSLHGAGVVSSHKLLAEQELVLRSMVTNREAEVRVVGEIGEQGDKHTYGVAFLDDSMDFWQVDFPPPPSLEERPLEFLLECSACGSPETVLNGDFEFDVVAIHGGLVKYCGECGFATVWKRPEAGVEPRAKPKQAAPKCVEVQRRESVRPLASEGVIEEHEWDLQPLAECLPPTMDRRASARPHEARENAGVREARASAETKHWNESRAASAALEDRRNRVRAKVNYFACVRSAAFGDDVVTCIDMSRGGLGFRTKNPYVISTEVQIAVPFSPESPNAPAIFVPARVVNIREVPEFQMFRCGVMFGSAGARIRAALRG
jgi:hypothetical protein